MKAKICWLSTVLIMILYAVWNWISIYNWETIIKASVMVVVLTIGVYGIVKFAKKFGNE